IEEEQIPQRIKDIDDRKYEFGENESWLSNRTCFLCVRDGNHIAYERKPQANTNYLRSYLLGFGMAMLAMQRGMIALHCSAVAGPGGAILIAGESGAGKSTLTSAFLQKGYEFLADDMVFVETDDSQTAWVYPAFPYQKLCRDAALKLGYDLSELIYIDEDKDKFLVPWKGDFSVERKKIAGLFFLLMHNVDQVDSKPVQGFDKMLVCADNLFLRKLLGKERYAPRIGQKCLELAAAVPIELIARPCGQNTQDRLVEKALDAIEKWG
ncbi:MAG: hypothetical protein K6G30_05805, partial [Acetatifactor sp.]|nr:hypothetical protein [Acetatifactor sp.]